MHDWRKTNDHTETKTRKKDETKVTRERSNMEEERP